jgi:ATP-dependent exoDNAse (exonuclease V) beta subunit
MKSSLGSLQKVYEKHSQNIIRDMEGYIEVSAIDKLNGENKEEYRARTISKIIQIIEECETKGYRRGQMAILVRKGKDGGEIARALAAQKIAVTTRESFRAEHSPAVRALVHYAGISAGKDLPQHVLLFAEALCELRSTKLTDCLSRNSHIADGKLIHDHAKILKELGGNGQIISAEGNVFDFFKSVMQQYDIGHDSGVDFLFDTVRQRCIGANSSIDEFITWWNEEKSHLYITEQKDPHAVQIQTIHKSKGLQFPVVIYPRFATSPPNDAKIWLDLPETEFGIPNIQVNVVNAFNDLEEIQPALALEADYNRLDRMNTFYVATTRPEDRLYIVQETSCKLAESTQFIQIMEKEFSPFKQERIWSDGNSEERAKETEQTEELKNSTIIFPNQSSTGMLRLRKIKGEETEEIREGVIFHYCISLIRSREDIHNALKKTSSKYNIHDKEEREILSTKIHNVVNHPLTSEWFHLERKQYNERELCLTGGSIIRPDKIVELEDEMLVIDFKTGKESSSHKIQMNHYIHALNEICTKPIRGILYYIQENRIVGL